MKPMILYYSKSGTTEKLAKRIQKDLDCDMVKIEPEKAYGNYLSAILRFLKENAKGAAPKARTGIPNLQAYDAVFVGYPIWGSDIPPFFADFLRNCGLSGKTVVPFATSGSTGIERSTGTLRGICPDASIVHPLHMGLIKRDNYDDWLSAVRKTAGLGTPQDGSRQDSRRES